MNKINFEDVFNLMQESFPETEYRTYENQKKLLQDQRYEIIEFRDDAKNLIAFIAVWNFETFCFIEHLAVSSKCRGMGIGSKIMKDFIAKSNSKIILEIEIPSDEISKKRFKFYEKLGFKMNHSEYAQPPLRKGAPAVKLNILSYPEKLSIKEFENIQNKLYSDVYKQTI